MKRFGRFTRCVTAKATRALTLVALAMAFGVILGRVRAHADLHAGLVRVREEYESGLSELKFNRSLLDEALRFTTGRLTSSGVAYDKVKALRESYRGVVMTSAATRSRKRR